MRKFQDMIFELVETVEPNVVTRARKMEQVFGVEKRSITSRIKGNTVLRVDELQKLKEAFNISWIDIAKWFGEDCVDGSLYNYVRLTKENFFHELPRYLRLYRETIEKLLKMEDPWIKVVCSEVPLFHLFRFQELTYFKLYMYYFHLFDNEMCYEDFRDRIKVIGVDGIFEQIAQAYAQLKSVEIWDQNTFEKLLLLVKECHQYGQFKYPETLVQMLDAADAFAVYMEVCVESTRKNNEESVEIYEFESTVREGFMVLGSGDHPVKFCPKVFMIQSFLSSDPDLMVAYSDSFIAQIKRSNSLFKSSRFKQLTFGKHFKVLVDQYREQLSA